MVAAPRSECRFWNLEVRVVRAVGYYLEGLRVPSRDLDSRVGLSAVGMHLHHDGRLRYYLEGL
jgi:hypothetical protein